MQRIVGTLEPSSALDIASGDGRNARWLAARGWSVTAGDFSEAALDLARSHAIGGIEWVHSDVSTWEPGRRFGLITMTYLQLPAEPLKALVARVADWLEPGGTLLVISHDLDNLAAGAPPTPSIPVSPPARPSTPCWSLCAATDRAAEYISQTPDTGVSWNRWGYCIGGICHDVGPMVKYGMAHVAVRVRSPRAHSRGDLASRESWFRS